MRSQELRQGLLRAPKLAWDVLARGRYGFKYDQVPMVACRMSLAKRFNLVRAGGNLLHRRLSPWSMPLHMQFELTNYCNLRCPVCPTGTSSVNRPPQAMEVDLFERVMEEAGPYLLTASLWAWGEPLLHPRLERILQAARKHDVITLLSTNGQCLDQDGVLDALIEEPPDYLILAFDGLTDETNSRYRVGAKVSPILEGVRRLAERKRERGLRKPVLNMRYIVMKHNQHELPHLDEFARRNGFELLTIRNMFFIETTCDGETAGRLTPDAEVGTPRAAISFAWSRSGSPPSSRTARSCCASRTTMRNWPSAASREMSPSPACGATGAPPSFARSSVTTGRA
jgi:molybdenum cofactor biosynthesis enzyme MoaA